MVQYTSLLALIVPAAAAPHPLVVAFVHQYPLVLFPLVGVIRRRPKIVASYPTSFQVLEIRWGSSILLSSRCYILCASSQ
jgi:hypothetical protein